MTAYVAETVEAMIQLNEGNELYIPSSSNFKTSDVISLDKSGDADTTIITLNGSSVKYGGGGASSMINKNDLSTFKNEDTQKDIKKATDSYQNLFGDPKEFSKLNKEKTKLEKEKEKNPEKRAELEEEIKRVEGEMKKNEPQPLTLEDAKRKEGEMRKMIGKTYPEFDTPEGEKMLDEEMEKIEGKVETQMNRLESAIKKAGCSKEKMDQAKLKMKVYHLSQFTASMLHNHPEKGIDKQAFSNSDLVETKGGKEMERKRSTGGVDADGNQSVMFSGQAYDKGYKLNKANCTVSPTNTYSTDMKHDNPALKIQKELKKRKEK